MADVSMANVFQLNGYVQSRRLPSASRMRREPLTVSDWDVYCPLIKQLYLVESRTWRDVMEILEARFGFIAT